MNNSISKLLLLALTIATLQSCASIMRGGEQQVLINAYEAGTGNIVVCDCILANDEGTFRTKSCRSVMVGRDKDLLTVDCQNEDFSGRVMIDGDVNWGFWAVDFFCIDLCLISGWIDGLSGSWAEYPTMIDVPLDPKNSRINN